MLPKYTDLITAVHSNKGQNTPTNLFAASWTNEQLNHSINVTLTDDNTIQVIYSTIAEDRTETHKAKQKDIYNLVKEIKEFYNQEIKPYL